MSAAVPDADGRPSADLPRVRLGRTGASVGVAGLGAGGASRLGTRTGASHAEAVALVRHALDLGVDVVDTAESYGTEGVVGDAIRGRRDEVVISTKVRIERDGRSVGPEEVARSLEASLRALGTDRVDVFHLHGVEPGAYRRAVEDLLPVLDRLRSQGKVRWLGITERFDRDPGHEMLEQALRDDHWDVVMVGFNLLNQSALRRVVPAAQARDVGILVMTPVRRALRDPDALEAALERLAAAGQLDRGRLDTDDPLGFLAASGVAGSVVEAAYRFARHDSGGHVVLTGTGSREHLEQNLRAIAGPPLPDHVREVVRDVFAGCDLESGE